VQECDKDALFTQAVQPLRRGNDERSIGNNGRWNESRRQVNTNCKVIKIGRDSSAMSVMINRKKVVQCKYLGSILTSDEKCSSEI